MKTCRWVIKTCVAAAALMVVAAVNAQAADAPARVQKAPPGPVSYDWTGLYVGGHVGWGSSSADDQSGFIGGGQVGFNYQIRQWVLGVEVQFSWSDISKGNHSIDWISTLAGRFGMTFDQWLLYGKLGVGWANLHTPWDQHTDRGPMFGLGAEYAFRNNWSAKLEYNFIDLNRDDNVHVVKVGVNYRFSPLPWSRY